MTFFYNKNYFSFYKNLYQTDFYSQDRGSINFCMFLLLGWQSGLFSRVAKPSGVDSDPDPTFEIKPDPYLEPGSGSDLISI